MAMGLIIAEFNTICVLSIQQEKVEFVKHVGMR